MKFLQLKFIPQSTDFALLLLRLWFGLTLLILHGVPKLLNYSVMSEKFPDVIGIGPIPTLILVILVEIVAATMVTLGVLTRLAALMIVVELGVAFFVAHGMQLSGKGNGELAFLFLAGFTAILFAGGGRFSLGAKKSGV